MKQVFGIIFLMTLGFSVNAQIKMQKSEGGLLFTENNEKVLFYQIEPKSKDGKYERCNYIHPLWGVDGTVLTEDFPADHLHHRGVFWAWHQIWIGNKQIGDPWKIEDFEQDITDVEFIAQKNGQGILKTQVEWKSEKWKKQGEKVPYLKENTSITIHPKTANYRKLDFEIRLLAMEENLKIGGSDDVKGYSGFSIRMVLPEDVLFTGPAGEIEPLNTAVKSAGYVNISGSLLDGNKKGGVVLVDDPQNPDYPQNWILRKKGSMQNAAYPGRGLIPVSTVHPLVLKYSLLVYSGELSDKKIQDIIK
ncbi:MAG: PmoA family protein [Draconibacterium sp.]|nr:PmoA family protein [Draconibacterium sp.]